MAAQRPKRKAVRQPSRRAALPRPGDPLVDAKGQVHKPDSMADLGIDDPRPMDIEPKDFRALSRRDMDDLPSDARLTNACACVFAYTILGISDREIQLTLNLTEDQLIKAREHEAYALLFSSCSDELINVNSMSLQARIAGMAHSALTNVFTLAKDAKKEETKLTANRDILDRAGTKIADQAERTKGKSVGLRIVVLEEGGTPKVDASVEVNV